MSTFGRGWVPVRRGLMEHVNDGRLTAEEYLVFVSVLLLVDASTAVWRGSARGLSTILRTSEHAMTGALQALETKGYVLRDFLPGKQGNYPIIIEKFDLTRGLNQGKRVDLAATRRKFGIPDGLLDKQRRKPFLGAISSACRAPLVRTVTSHDCHLSSSEAGVDFADDCDSSSAGCGVVFAEVSTRETEESEGEEGAGSPSPRSVDPCQAESPSLHSGDSKASATPSLRLPPIFPAEPTPGMPPAEQLATLFYIYQGRRSKFDTVATWSAWTSTFDRLIRQYGIDDLSGCMRWGFEVDSFWPAHLVRAQDPLAYLEKQLAGELMSRYIGSRTGSINAAKAQFTKGTTNGKSTSGHVPANGRGKQPVDNSFAMAEAKRKLAESFRAGE